MGLLSCGLAVAVQNKKATLPNCGTGCNIVKFLKEKNGLMLQNAYICPLVELSERILDPANGSVIIFVKML